MWRCNSPGGVRSLGVRGSAVKEGADALFDARDKKNE